MEEHQRFKGSLIGLACGDALGTTIEFRSPGSFEPIDSIIGGGPFNLKRGQWTDDTSMALCLAESIIRCEGFNLKDQIERYYDWYMNGHLSCTGDCFDIGTTVRVALKRFGIMKNPYSGSKDKNNAGNGSIMRLAPVPLFYHADIPKVLYYSAESSRTTHQATEAIDACKLLGILISGSIMGLSKEELLSKEFINGCINKDDQIWANSIKDIALGSYKKLNPPAIQGSGYCVKSLEAALWAFYNSNNFKEGLLLAVNLGDDADTTGAVYGQLAGAFYGIDGIPNEWIEIIAMKELILKYATELYKLSRSKRKTVNK